MEKTPKIIAEDFVLAAIMNNPLLFIDTDYHFSINDFEDQFHRIMFGAVEYLAKNGMEKIGSMDIDQFLKQYHTQYQVFLNNDGVSYLQDVLSNYDEKKLAYYYHTLKKYSLVKHLQDVGIDTTNIYDPDLTDPELLSEMYRKFDSLKADDILLEKETQLILIKEQFGSNSDRVENSVGDNILELIDELKETPEIGLPMRSKILTTLYRGMRKGCVYMTSAGSGSGKALPNSTVIPTPNGWKQVKDIKVGDELFDAHGKPTKVLGVFPQGKLDVYQVTFRDGRTALCNNEHLWSYYTHSSHTLKTSTVNDLLERKKLFGLVNSAGNPRYSIPVAQAVDYPAQDLKLDPYLLGLLIGDGCFREHTTNRNLTFSDGEGILIENFKKLGWTPKRHSLKNYTYSFEGTDGHNIHVKQFCDNYDLQVLFNKKSHEKEIPEPYLIGSIEQRLALLNGLLDTDGHVDTKGRISFSSVSKKLIDQMVLLARSLGYITTITYDIRENKYPNSNCCYTLRLKGSKELKSQLFTFKRKKDILKKWLAKDQFNYPNNTLGIVDICKLNYKEDMTCFYVDNAEHLFLMNDYIATHNTRLMMGDATYLAVPEYYDTDLKQWVYTGLKEKVLIIETELELREIQTMVLGAVAGVPETHILDGKYYDDEEDRVRKAAKLIKESGLYMVAITNYDTDDLINTIKKYYQIHGVEYVVYDYLSENLKILAEGARKSKVSGLRTDQILLQMITALKDCAKTLNIFIETSTQLSGDFKNATELDASYLRSAKSLSDKLDVGSILMPVRESDQAVIDAYCAKGFERVPNFVLSIYKIRRGSYQNIKVYIYFDRAQCRIYDCFVTDNKGVLLEDVAPTNVQLILEQTKEKKFETAFTGEETAPSLDDEHEEDVDF